MCNFEAFKALMEKTRKEFSEFLDNEESDPMSLWVVYLDGGKPPYKYIEIKVTGFAVDKHNYMLYSVCGEIFSSSLVYASEEEAQKEVDRRNQKFKEDEKKHRIAFLVDSITYSERTIEDNKAWIDKCKAELEELQKED